MSIGLGILPRLDAATVRALRNPFEGELPGSPASISFGEGPASRVDRLLDEGALLEAECVVLAIGHAHACAHPDDPGRVLDAASLPARLDGRLPRKRSAYRRLALAAGRAYRALSAARGSSRTMREARSEIWAACFGESLLHALHLEPVIRDQDILILGETGTGKEVLAHAVMQSLPGPADGSPAPSSAINAAAIPDTLVESELFGHVRGAFTGARANRPGRLRAAHRGVFFLDEVGDLPLTSQVKLLRVIETNLVYPVGSDEPHDVDIRYVAATHRDLAREVQRGTFRQDLFERLAGNVIVLPPLRERPEDIVEIGMHCVAGYVPNPSLLSLADPIEEWLRAPVAQRYPWPGNVRELQNAIRNLLLGLAPDLEVDAAPSVPVGSAIPTAIAEGRSTLEQVTSWYLSRVLERTGYNLAHAARILGVDRTTVDRRARRAGLLARARAEAE